MARAELESALGCTLRSVGGQDYVVQSLPGQGSWARPATALEARMWKLLLQKEDPNDGAQS